MKIEISDAVLKAIKKLVEYDYDAEYSHYDECPTDNHIFLSIRKINNWLKKIK